MAVLRTPIERCTNKAEKRLLERLAEILPDRFYIYSNIDFYSSQINQYTEGEIDILILDLERGIIVLEVKAGQVYFNRAEKGGIEGTTTEQLKNFPNCFLGTEVENLTVSLSI